jgi:hypothetical protein
LKDNLYGENGKKLHYNEGQGPIGESISPKYVPCLAIKLMTLESGFTLHSREQSLENADRFHQLMEEDSTQDHV